MEINPTKQPAIAPAPFGMSARGHALGLATGAVTSATSGLDLGLSGQGATTVTRDRGSNANGAIGFAVPAYVPGTRAWSPPVS